MIGFSEIANNRSVTVEFNFFDDLDNIFVETQFSLGNPYVMFLNKTINMCKFFKSKYRDPLMYIIYSQVSKIIKVDQCPIKKVINLQCDFNIWKFKLWFLQGAYVVKDFIIDADLLPKVIKSTRFSFSLDTFIEKKPKMIKIAHLKFHGFINNLDQKRG